MDIGYIIEIIPTLFNTLPLTLMIFLVSSLFTIVLGIIIALLKIAETPFVKPLLNVYSSFARSNPGIVHIFLVYYGLPAILQLVGIDITGISRVIYSIVALVLYSAPFFAIAIEAAYHSVPESQFNAAKSVGMTQSQMMRRIVLPQVVPIALPNLGNAWIDLLQDTSLLFTIGLIDLMGQADIIIANNFGINQLEVYVAIALIYWALTGIITFIISLLEKRTRKYVM
ncbi:amino acid ABC transporter permease [Aerococcaceae bacterium DSM 111022]|nr:amino acid ABC transporter permease [Aerococcaceae bacterium DSM 111022]